MADTIIIKPGYSALYLIEMSNRAVENLRASEDGSAEVETIEQSYLADTIINSGLDLEY